jgi:membrane protease YdiL (CAAX protease family)
LTLAVAAGIALGSGNRTLAQNLTAHQIVGTIFNAVTAAVVVAFLEEILFRGGIFGGLRRNFYWPLALAVSSLIYAFVHFLQPADPAGPVAWNTGLILLPRMLAGFLNFSALVPAFLTLTLAGILLGLGYQLTGNLYFSFGLHAGWIFWLKTYGAFTIDAPQAVTRFYGTGRLIDGWLTFLVLAVTLAVFNVLPLKPARAPYTISR